jgi:hypothetical protein
VRKSHDGTRLSKGQVHTLEAFGALFIIAFAAVLTAQIVSVPPDGTGEAVTRNDRVASDMLAASGEDGLKRALLNWSGREAGFNGSPNGQTYYRPGEVPGRLGDALSLVPDGKAYRLELVCDGKAHPFVGGGGTEGTDSASASTTVSLDDRDRLSNGFRLDRSPSYPCDDADEDSGLYSAVEVGVTVWTR